MPGIDWEIAKLHEPQMLRNHSQTCERLAERAGLSPLEMLAVLRDEPFPYHLTTPLRTHEELAKLEQRAISTIEAWLDKYWNKGGKEDYEAWLAFKAAQPRSYPRQAFFAGRASAKADISSPLT